MNFATMGQDFLEVFVAALVLGAGLPLLFALGVRFTAPSVEANGSVNHPHGALKALGYLFFAVIVLMIIAGVLWITQGVIFYYTGIDLFGTGGKGH